ncbi:hypothetical protein MKW98_010705 [Papaver atlanticum]|uniref:RRM domain-containing protein n=1 Tax=Papaver atlanticum TaxID=357466 RepID=A0AAD4SI94_9MAGN|nr:hypothetical protein MKW98_010705 [Papaver atlanticum]
MRSLFISHALHSLLALEECLLVILQANLVIMAIVGAMFGAAFGCWTNDSLGKKRSVLMADVVTFLATMLVAFSSVPSLVVGGTMIVGFGVGMVSMTSSLYILEASPPRLRSSFDCFSSLLIVVGQALSYRVNLLFTEEPRTWSCMIGVAGIPALVQFMLIWFLPESPKWIYRKVEARKAVPEDNHKIMNRSDNRYIGPIQRKRIFVSGLASTVTESDFKQYFEQFGVISNTELMYDPNTQRPRGFGFITYESEDSVDRALLKTIYEVNGKMVNVQRAFSKRLSPPKRVDNFLAGGNQGFSPISIGGFSQPGPSGLTTGVNSDQALSASYGENANFNCTSSRYSSSVDYNWGEGAVGSVLTSTTTNIWGNSGGMSFSTNSSCSNAAYLGSGSGFIGNAAGTNCISSPLCAQTEGSTSSCIAGSPYINGGNNYGFQEEGYGRNTRTFKDALLKGTSNAVPQVESESTSRYIAGSPYRNGGNNCGFQGGGYGRNTRTFKDALLKGTPNAVPQVESESFYGGGSSVYGNSIWRSTDSDNISDSFGLGVASDGRDSNYGFEGVGICRNSGTSEDTPLYGTSNGVPERELDNFYAGGSICGNSVCWSTDCDDISNSFGYELSGVAAVVVTKSSAGGYSETDRQVNRGVARRIFI